VLIGFARHANQSGVSWPGDSTLIAYARKYGEPDMSHEGMRKLRQKLIESGELLEVERSGGPGKPAKYRVNYRLLMERADAEDTSEEDTSVLAVSDVNGRIPQASEPEELGYSDRAERGIPQVREADDLGYSDGSEPAVNPDIRTVGSVPSGPNTRMSPVKCVNRVGWSSSS
jgi:hypothetical protein